NGKVLDDTGSGLSSWLANGIYWATDNGASVINMSLGAPGSCPNIIGDAVTYAWAHNVVIVAAAGNDGTAGPQWPASCPNVLSVAATDQNDARASFSSYGTQVSVAAPGVQILSTYDVG